MVRCFPLSVEGFQRYRIHALSDHCEGGGEGSWESAALAAEQFEKAFPLGLQTPEVVFLGICAEGGQEVGTVVLRELLRPTGRELFVLDLVIYPMHRRQGFASAALVQLEEWAAIRGIESLTLSVMQSNQAARALYEKAGFTPLFTRMKKCVRSR